MKNNWLLLTCGLLTFNLINAQSLLTTQDFEITDNVSQIETTEFTNDQKLKTVIYNFVDGFVSQKIEIDSSETPSYAKSTYVYNENKDAFDITKIMTIGGEDSTTTTENFKIFSFNGLKFTFPTKNLVLSSYTSEKLSVKINGETVHKYLIKLKEANFVEFRDIEFKNGAVYKQYITIYDDYGHKSKHLIKDKVQVFVDHTITYSPDGLIKDETPNKEDLEVGTINHHFEKDDRENWVKYAKTENALGDVSVKEYTLRKLRFGEKDSTGFVSFDKQFETMCIEKATNN